MSAYFQLNTKDNSVESLKNAWTQIDRSDIAPLSQRYNKPILFTEIGYRSVSSARFRPYDFQGSGEYDEIEQLNAYTAMFEYWQDKDYIAGVSLWDFYADPAAGGAGNTDYTPQNKPAEQIMKAWFKPDEVTTVQVGLQANRSKFPFLNQFNEIDAFLGSLLKTTFKPRYPILSIGNYWLQG